jgi:hypothetical protein
VNSRSASPLPAIACRQGRSHNVKRDRSWNESFHDFVSAGLHFSTSTGAPPGTRTPNPRIKSGLLGRCECSACTNAPGERPECTHCTGMPPVLVPRAVPWHPCRAAEDTSPNVAKAAHHPAGIAAGTGSAATHRPKLTIEAVHHTDALVCIVRRMPRMQVYLPDDLYQQVKTRHLPA